MTISVPAKGVGRKDYTMAVERSVTAFITPSLRQTEFVYAHVVSTPAVPFPAGWMTPCAMPQEDGSLWWEASSISLHFAEVSITCRQNALVEIGMLRWDSLAAWMAGLPPEVIPHIFGYSSAHLYFVKPIATRPGSSYWISWGIWLGAAPLTYQMTFHGVAAELTPAWM